MTSLRRCLNEGFNVRRDINEDVECRLGNRALLRRDGTYSRFLNSKDLIRYLIIRRSRILALLVSVLMKAALCTCVLRLLTSIRTALRRMTIGRILRYDARRNIALAKLCVRRVSARMRLSIRASTDAFLSILYVGRGFISSFVCACLLLFYYFPNTGLRRGSGVPGSFMWGRRVF